MKRVTITGLVALLFVVSALPGIALVANAQANTINDNAVCQNILGSIGDINRSQYGNSNAIATGDSAAAAEVAQKQHVTIEQVDECLKNADLNDDRVIEVSEVVNVVKGEKVAAAASVPASSGPSVASVAELPDTGGAAILALSAGVLLVGGGLVARRMVR